MSCRLFSNCNFFPILTVSRVKTAHSSMLSERTNCCTVQCRSGRGTDSMMYKMYRTAKASGGFVDEATTELQPTQRRQDDSRGRSMLGLDNVVTKSTLPLVPFGANSWNYLLFSHMDVRIYLQTAVRSDDSRVCLKANQTLLCDRVPLAHIGDTSHCHPHPQPICIHCLWRTSHSKKK